MSVRLLGLALTACLGACVSLERGGLYAPDRDAVFVEYFDNQTFYREVEFELTEEIVSEILSRPGLRLTSKEEAEILLSGRVVQVKESVLSEDPQRVVTSGSSTITASIEVKDAATGEILKQTTLSQRGEFVPAQGQDAATARRVALAFLARDIVSALEIDF